MIKERNYGIDLLRLILMYMVCILHTLGQGGILNAAVAGTNGYKAFWFLEILSYCAVDGFAFISGYTANEKPRKFEKLVDMWFQAFFYSFIVTIIFIITGISDTLGKTDIIKCAFPVTYGKFWYFTAFFVMFFAIPVLNKFLFSIEENAAKTAFIIFVILFSILGTLTDPFKSGSGYSAIWLMILYCLGALGKKIKIFETRRSITLIILWALCIILTWCAHIFAGIESLTSYISPTILFSGIIMVVLFSRIRIKGTIIAILSPLAFGIYLFQSNTVIWNQFLKDAFADVVNKPLFIGIPLVFALAFIIFVSGLAVEFIRSKIAKFIRLPVLSRRIVTLFDTVIKKSFIFLR